MDYKICYIHKAISKNTIISNCLHIMDAIFKFYSLHGISSEIIMIDKVE